MSEVRRAVVLFVPAPAAEGIDEIRRRWDPVMSARIDPHITLVHDVVGNPDMADLDDALSAAVGGIDPFEITLTIARCWGPARYGVYLGVEDPTGCVTELHSRLAALEAPGWLRAGFRPHVTLVHGRTVDPQLAEPAWATLDGWRADWPVEIAAVDVIELDEHTGWHRRQRFALVVDDQGRSAAAD